MTGRLLLASNSTNPGGAYLDHLGEAILAHFSGAERVAFVPYALADTDAYASSAEAAFATLGIHLESVHRHRDPARALSDASGVFVGGGNTFRLLDRLIHHRLIGAIRDLVASGGGFMGTSAGSNVACPTIRTTNDMPIVEPPTFRALGLVTFQINPHFVERDPDTPHGGETRRQRLVEYHEENALPVVGLREGSWLEIRDSVALRGPHPATLFRRGLEPVEVGPGEAVHEYLADRAPSAEEIL